MPALTIPNSFSANTTARSSEVNANFNAIATLLNSTKLDSTNVQTGGIAEANIASSAVSAAKLATDAVTTAKIQASAVTYAKLGSDVVSTITPAGSVIMYAGTSAPTGWLLCDGSPVSRTTYSTLYSVVGNSFGDGSQNADGSSSGNGTNSHFNLPDMRGRFVRGFDGTANRDPDAASRTAMLSGGNTGDAVGSVQEDQLESHSHSTDAIYLSNTGGPPLAGGAAYAGFTATVNATGGNETRPKNITVNYLIKT